MAAIHISEAEAVRDFAGVLAKIDAGAEIVIDRESTSPVLLKIAPSEMPRLLSESLRLAREHGSSVTLDEDFADDLRAVIDSHQEPLLNPRD